MATAVTRRGCLSAVTSVLQTSNSKKLPGQGCGSTGSSRPFLQGKGDSVNSGLLPGDISITTATKQAVIWVLEVCRQMEEGKGQNIPALPKRWRRGRQAGAEKE